MASLVLNVRHRVTIESTSTTVFSGGADAHVFAAHP